MNLTLSFTEIIREVRMGLLSLWMTVFQKKAIRTNLWVWTKAESSQITILFKMKCLQSTQLGNRVQLSTLNRSLKRIVETCPKDPMIDHPLSLSTQLLTIFLNHCFKNSLKVTSITNGNYSYLILDNIQLELLSKPEMSERFRSIHSGKSTREEISHRHL